MPPSRDNELVQQQETSNQREDKPKTDSRSLREAHQKLTEKKNAVLAKLDIQVRGLVRYKFECTCLDCDFNRCHFSAVIVLFYSLLQAPRWWRRANETQRAKKIERPKRPSFSSLYFRPAPLVLSRLHLLSERLEQATYFSIRLTLYLYSYPSRGRLPNSSKTT